MLIFEYIGDNSVYIIAIISIILLLYIKKYIFLIFYIIGLLCNDKLNKIIKEFIHDSKMPSGHFQGIFYSFAIIILLFSKEKYFIYILSIFFIIILSCLYNCLHYKYHTLFQIVNGSILGSFIGFSVLYIYENFFLGIKFSNER